MDKKTPLEPEAPPPDYDSVNPTPQTLAAPEYPAEKDASEFPADNGASSSDTHIYDGVNPTPQTLTAPEYPAEKGASESPADNGASSSDTHITPALKLKVGKVSVLERNYNIWSPDATVLYTIDNYYRYFSSKPELYLRHRSSTEIASINLRINGDVDFSMHGEHYKAKKNRNPLSMCWTVDRGDEKYEVRHTQTGIGVPSTKHLKLVDSQGQILVRFISHLARSTRTLGKVEFFGEGERAGVAELTEVERDGPETRWQEWCLAVLVGIAEKEKRREG